MAENDNQSDKLTSSTMATGWRSSPVPAGLRQGLGAMALVMGGYLLIFALWLVFKWGGEENLALISDLAYLPVSLFASLCAFLVVRKTDLTKRARWGWAFISLAMLSAFLADLVWFYFEIVLQQEPFPSLADPFYLAYYGFVFVGLILLPAAATQREWWFKLFLDVAIVTAAAWIPIWYFLVMPTMADPESDLITRLLAAAYPVADLILLAGVFSLALRRMERSQLNSLGILFAAFLVTFVGDIVYTYTSLAGTYASGQLIDITWIVGYLLVALAALQSLYPVKHAPSPVFDRLYEQSTKALPVIVSLSGYALVVALAFIGLQQELPLNALVVTTVLLTGLILARQMIELSENRRLTVELQAASEQMQALAIKNELAALERERDIMLVAELSQDLTSLTDLSTLLPKAVELIQQRLDLYYAQIYLFDPHRRSLVLRAGSGLVGAELLRRGHRLPVSLASINGTAAAERRPVIIANVHQSKNFRPNSLLPDTQSEAAIPMIIGDRLIGVLDMQSNRPHAFQDDELPVLQALAGQLAVALENAATLARLQDAQKEIEKRTQVQTRQGWMDFLDGIQRNERLGFRYEAGSVFEVDRTAFPVEEQEALQVPIEVSGEMIGALTFPPQPDRQWTPEQIKLAKDVAVQTARQIENLRLLAQAERYRLEAEENARRLTRQGWDEYQRDLQPELDFVYDHTQVRQEDTKQPNGSDLAYRHPLVVHDMPVGALDFEAAQPLSEDDLALIQTVAESLSAHIDNLRLNAQTRMTLGNMETLNEVMRAGSQTLELDIILDEILKRILSVAEFGAGLISIEDLETLKLRLVVHHQLPEAMVTKLTTAGLDGTPCDVVYRSGDVVILSDLEHLPEDLHATNLEDGFVRQAMQRPLAMGFHSYFGMALAPKGQVIGTICLFDSGTKTIKPTILSVLEAIGQQVGMLVENARLFQSTQKALLQTQALYQAIAQMNKATSYDEILTALADHTFLGRADQLLLMGVFDCPMGGGQTPQWIYPVAWRSDQPLEVARRYPADLMGEAMSRLADGHLITTIGSLDAQPPMVQAVRGLLDFDRPMENIYGIPLILGGQSIGFVIGLSSQAARFIEEDVRQLKAVAGQAAIAVESRLLLEQAQAKARQEQRLREVSENVFAASDVDAILRRAVEQVGRSLGAQAFIYLGQGNGLNLEKPGNGANSEETKPEAVEMAKM
jgi:GAF domain-containing protein